MLPSVGKSFVVGRYNAAVPHLSKRFLHFEGTVNHENFLKRVEASKKIEEEEEEKKHHLSDKLEYRNVGRFKTVRDPSSTFVSLLKMKTEFHDITKKTLTSTMKHILNKAKVSDQSYNPDRVKALGPDLAAAHFIVCRGGGVKFVGENKFIRGKMNRSNEVLPGEKDPSLKVEAIDFSGQGEFVYEAISNLADLKYFKWVSFKNCQYVDNWFLDHLSFSAPNLEYIDLTGCPRFNQFGLSCFYRFKQLKCVNVENVSQSTDFNLACLTLEAEHPGLVFLGLKLKPTPKSVFN